MKMQTRALTFEDVLLVPQYSDVLPSEVLLASQLTRSITLNAPILSAAMDTVTEYRMAIAVARQGGIGIIHKNMPTESQCEQVVKVKKSESGIIIDPVHIEAHNSLAEAKAIMDNYKISGVPVVDSDKTLIGILTNRDIRFESDFSKNVGSVMTSKNLVTSEVGTSLDAALESTSGSFSIRAASSRGSSRLKTFKKSATIRMRTKIPLDVCAWARRLACVSSSARQCLSNRALMCSCSTARMGILGASSKPCNTSKRH